MLNVLLFPMLAIPKSPILSEVPGLPNRTFFTRFAATFEDIYHI